MMHLSWWQYVEFIRTCESGSGGSESVGASVGRSGRYAVGAGCQGETGGMQKMAVSLMEGYQAYAKTHPEADYSHLGDNFFEYLKNRWCKADHEKVFFKDSKGEWKSNHYRRKGTEASDRYHAGV